MGRNGWMKIKIIKQNSYLYRIFNLLFDGASPYDPLLGRRAAVEWGDLECTMVNNQSLY